jgi:phosphatidylserine/phosphatidylglycerophosphate/cardiolipin synthase-like enzyme
LQLIAGVAGLVVASALAVGWWRILRIVQRPSWPPGPGAVTAAGAQTATETFAGQPGHSPHELGIEYAWSTAAAIEPWAAGRNFFPRILEDVARARSTVHVLMYGWREGAIGQRLAELLERRRREGVEVRILVDALGSRAFYQAKAMYRRLADAGAAIVVNDVLPIDRDGLYQARKLDWRQAEVGHADHRKLLVIDGSVAWLGGAGIEDHFADGRFHDVMVRVTGNVVLQLQAVFLTSFSAHGGTLSPGPGALAGHFPAQPDPGTSPAAVLQVIPGGFQSATQALRERLDAARERLDVMNPYVTDPDMRERILAAARRGVRVRLVTSGRSNNWLAAASLRRHYADLVDAGVEIWEYPGVAHAKIIIADDWVQFGTVNLDAWALYRNFEIGVLARSARVVELFENRVFEPAIAGSAPGVPSSGFAGRSGGWLGDRLAYFL